MPSGPEPASPAAASAASPAPQAPFDALSRFERFAVRTLGWVRTGPGRRAATFYQREVLERVFALIVESRLVVHGLDRLADVPPDAPLLLVANHRTFFDLFVLADILQRQPGMRRRPSFPVRANFFYENPLGLAICLALSGGTMYPPFFRSAEKKAFNRYALSLLLDELRSPGALVGFHPEGTRSTRADALDLLPAQPGAGELALKARPLVVPAFIEGLSNSIGSEIWATLRRRKDRPIHVNFGAPVPLAGYPSDTRLSHHKRCADVLLASIRALGEEGRARRAAPPNP